jgi:hypothetical protein
MRLLTRIGLRLGRKSLIGSFLVLGHAYESLKRMDCMHVQLASVPACLPSVDLCLMPCLT